jgi:hypothetical protein
MLNRSMSRLATAVAVAGTVCALGAASAAAAATPGSSWSGRTGPVPHAFTNATPAMTSVSFAGHAATLVAWKGQRGAHVFYETTSSPHLSGGWSALASIPGAHSNAGPSVGSYVDPLGHEAVLAVWKGLGNHKIFYSQGETRGNGTISWGAPATLTKSKFTSTTTAPAVFFPANAPHDRVIVAWKGPFDHVRYSVGTPAGRGFTWSSSNWLSAAANTRTSAAPALAEVQTGTAKGTLQVFWKGLHSDQIRFATTGDPLNLTTSGGLTWSAAATVPHAATTAGPAVSSLGLHGFGPLLLTYKGPAGLHVRYQTRTSTGWSAGKEVPGALTAVGPAQLRGVLATTSADASGSIFFHIFS